MTLREQIKESGLTQVEAAKVIGVPLRTLCKWLAGDAPKVLPAIYAMDKLRANKGTRT